MYITSAGDGSSRRDALLLEPTRLHGCYRTRSRCHRQDPRQLGRARHLAWRDRWTELCRRTCPGGGQGYCEGEASAPSECHDRLFSYVSFPFISPLSFLDSLTNTTTQTATRKRTTTTSPKSSTPSASSFARAIATSLAS